MKMMGLVVLVSVTKMTVLVVWSISENDGLNGCGKCVENDGFSFCGQWSKWLVWWLWRM